MTINLTSLREKAVRINRAATQATSPSQMQIMSANSRAFMNDILEVTNGVLGLFPEGDFKPITNNWLIKIGGEWSDDKQFIYFHGLAISAPEEDENGLPKGLEVLTYREVTLAGPDICGNYVIPSIAIRMDVRILLQRLGLDSKIDEFLEV